VFCGEEARRVKSVQLACLFISLITHVKLCNVINVNKYGI